MLEGDAEVAARCVPADSVGGDFYTFNRFGRGRVGVMLGDVSSHGFAAALVMALVIAAAGIHAAGSATPDETLERLLESLAEDLATTEMFLTVFYGVLDPRAVAAVLRQRRASARLADSADRGRPSASRRPRRRSAWRRGATSSCAQVPWKMGQDLLCLCTDGLVDARDPDGEAFGEARLLEGVTSRRGQAPEAIVSALIGEVRAFAPHPGDDITLLILRI